MNPSLTDQAYTTRIGEGSGGGDDAALVQRIAGEDETALAALYDRWVQPIYSLVMQILRDPDDAEDVVEETFWQVWQRAGAYDGARGTVRTWLLTIARSRALDRLRAHRRRRDDTIEGASALLGADAPDPSVLAERSERAALVADALAALPADQRRALELAYFSGLSQSEIATLLGEPLGTVKTRMRLGVQKLRERLAVLQEHQASPRLAGDTR